MDELRIADTLWRPLRSGDGVHIARALSDEPWAKAYHDPLHSERLIELTEQGKGRGFVCTDVGDGAECFDQLHGIIGITPYPTEHASWHTLTFLAPCLQRRSLTGPIKAVQHAWASELGIGDGLAASVAASNHRSRRAMAKIYPNAQRILLHESWRPGGGRDTELWLLDGPPPGIDETLLDLRP